MSFSWRRFLKLLDVCGYGEDSPLTSFEETFQKSGSIWTFTFYPTKYHCPSDEDLNQDMFVTILVTHNKCWDLTWYGHMFVYFRVTWSWHRHPQSRRWSWCCPCSTWWPPWWGVLQLLSSSGPPYSSASPPPGCARTTRSRTTLIYRKKCNLFKK